MANLSRPHFQCNGATVAREAIRLESLDDLASPFWFQKSSLPVIFTFSPITLLDQIAGFLTWHQLRRLSKDLDKSWIKNTFINLYTTQIGHPL